jgi:hypothetical protein
MCEVRVMPIKQVRIELGWGPAKISGTWEPDAAEREAAWELYVERGPPGPDFDLNEYLCARRRD